MIHGSVDVEINVTGRLMAVYEDRRRVDDKLMHGGAAAAGYSDLGNSRGILQQLVYLVIVLMVDGGMPRIYDAFLYPELNGELTRMKKLQRIIDTQDNKFPH